MKNVLFPRALAIASALLATVLTSESAFAISISATAQGSVMPTTESFPNTVTNGDFLITGGEDLVVGDGADERTNWTFDFTADPNLSAFSATEMLESAKLTLTLTTCCNIKTDRFAIQSLPSINAELIQNLPRDTTQTVELELLDFYNSSDILRVLNRGTGGTLPMVYFDDALVSFARLELSDLPTQSVPESSSILGLFTLGAVALRSPRLRQNAER